MFSTSKCFNVASDVCNYSLSVIFRDQEVSESSHLDTVAEDQEDQEQDDQGDKAMLASSSSSEGDLELPTASASTPPSSSKSRSQPPKPAPKPVPPRQRPVIPPRPKDTATTNSEGLEPTPFDLPDPFQALESSSQPDKEQKPRSPPIAPKPVRLPKPASEGTSSSVSKVSSCSSPCCRFRVQIYQPVYPFT